MDAITYAYTGSKGVKIETEFVFDLKLPLDFKPYPKDGEVECFYLMSIGEVINIKVKSLINFFVFNFFFIKRLKKL